MLSLPKGNAFQIGRKKEGRDGRARACSAVTLGNAFGSSVVWEQLKEDTVLMLKNGYKVEEDSVKKHDCASKCRTKENLRH